MRHILRAILTLSVALAMTAAALPIAASPGDEAQFVSLINQSRAAAGLGPLADYSDLTDDARVHTGDMIGAGQVFHSTGAQLGSYTTGWSLLGENVGMGPNPALLHQAFMNSSTHRANILGDYDRVGVGVDRSPEGAMFVTVLFMKTAAPATTTTTAPPPPTTTTAPPPPPTTTTAPPPPTTTTTAPPPPPTSTTAPGPTVPPEPTTTAAQVPAPAPPVTTTSTTPQPDDEADPEPTDIAATPGERPANRVAGAVNERTFAAFRPVFSLLTARGTDPIVRLTANGVRVVIE